MVHSMDSNPLIKNTRTNESLNYWENVGFETYSSFYSNCTFRSLFEDQFLRDKNVLQTKHSTIESILKLRSLWLSVLKHKYHRNDWQNEKTEYHFQIDKKNTSYQIRGTPSKLILRNQIPIKIHNITKWLTRQI